MAKKQNKKEEKNINVANIYMRAPNRRNIDIEYWRNALRYAEGESKTRYTLYDIYEELILDDHLDAVMDKRITPIVNLEIKFFNKDGSENDDINTIINTSYFETLLREIVKSKFYGFSLLQLNWKQGDTSENQTISIDRRHVKPEFNIVTRTGFENEGLNYTEYPDVMFVGDASYGKLLKSAPAVIFKRNNTSDWAEFNEIFGRPYPQGKYEDDDSGNIAAEAFDKAGFERYIVAPKDVEIELHQGTSGTGGGDLYQNFKDSLDKALSILFLGQNLTTQVDKNGSYAASRVHGDVEQSLNEADRKYVIRNLNEKLIPILNYFGYNIEGEFKFIYNDEISLKDRIEIDTKLANIIPFEEDYFYETYGIPKPKGKIVEKKVEKVVEETKEKDLSVKSDNENKFSNFLKRLFFFKEVESINLELDNLYQTENCSTCRELAKDEKQIISITEKTINRALNNIYKNTFNLKTEIEPNLFDFNLNQFDIAIDDIFGTVSFGEPNYQFIEELKYNNAVFTAFKTHRQQNDLAKQLLNEEGVLKSFSKFKTDTESIIGKYNTDWLQTEYNTAVLRARQASNWKIFEANKDLYPNLKWLPSTSVEQRQVHVPYYNRVWSLDDKFWKQNFPGNLWNCKCDATSTNKPVSTNPKGFNNPKGLVGDKGLNVNPAFNSEIFTLNTHPYRTNGYLKPKQLDKVAKKKANESTNL